MVISEREKTYSRVHGPLVWFRLVCCTNTEQEPKRAKTGAQKQSVLLVDQEGLGGVLVAVGHML